MAVQGRKSKSIISEEQDEDSVVECAVAKSNSGDQKQVEKGKSGKQDEPANVATEVVFPTKTASAAANSDVQIREDKIMKKAIPAASPRPKKS